VTLSGLQGPVMGLFFTLCSGESLTSHYVLLHEDSRIENTELFDNLFGNNKNWYFIPFSSHLAEDYSSRSNQGYQVFMGTEKLVFTTNKSITPDAFQIDV
jgi:hypothetical protein